MHRNFEDARRWSHQGTTLLLSAVAGLSTDGYEEPSALPGWTRQHLIAHVDANADALGNLVRWAATGVPTPMYADADERAAAIERGARLSAGQLSRRVRESANRLAAASAALTPEQWFQEIVTAQGRTVSAAEIPWMRAREVFVHTVDLVSGVTFDDLPEDFLLALEADVIAKRGEVPAIRGPLPQRIAWLTGRPHTLTNAPELGPWL